MSSAEVSKRPGPVCGSAVPWWLAPVEIAMLFGLFFLFGGWPVPDVNEQYYIGKAIHFWNPQWLPADKFLDTPDSHWFFYAVFGLFSLVMSPPVMAWFGRIVIWLLTAWGWRTLAWTVFRRPWFSVLSGAAFLFYLDAFHLAGEWIAGGIEGKGFAFPFVFFGLAAFYRGRYNRAWILLGLASAFHVLVGGWTVLACLACWFITNLGGGLTKRLTAMLPGLLAGGALSLLGLVPALMLDGGASAATVHEAHRVYVFERLSHHLVPSMMPWTFLTRFVLLACAWLLAGRLSLWRRPQSNAMQADAMKESDRRLDGFVFAACAIAACGLGIDFGSRLAVEMHWIPNRNMAAELLRFYWFRLSDWAVPLGCAFGFCAMLDSTLRALVASDRETANKTTNETMNSARRLPTLPGGVILWLVAAFGLYAVAKTCFWHYATIQAKALTVDPNYPVVPVAVEAPSFLTAVVALALILPLCLYAVRKSAKRGSGPIPFVAAGYCLLAAVMVVVAPLGYTMDRLNLRCSTVIPRSNPPKETISDGWIETCRWIAQAEHTDPNAVFLVPRGCDSFKYYAHRALVGSWKEIPQDAASIVSWFDMMQQLYTIPGEKGPQRWNQPLVIVLIAKGRARVLAECEQYGIDYIVIENPPYYIASNPKALERYQAFYDNDFLWQNGHFTVFRMKKAPKADSKDDAPRKP